MKNTVIALLALLASAGSLALIADSVQRQRLGANDTAIGERANRLRAAADWLGGSFYASARAEWRRDDDNSTLVTMKNTVIALLALARMPTHGS
jgi:hypothetical protein